MASLNPVPKLYMSVIEDVISEVHGLFLNDGVDEQVLKELKTLWENKLMQSKAVEGFHTEMRAAALQAAQQQQQVQHLHQAQQYVQPAQAQAAAPLMGYWYSPQLPQLINPVGQLMQVVRTQTGAQYILQQPQQQIMLQQQMPPGGAQPIGHVLAPLQGGHPQQTRVMQGQPQQYLFAPGNRAGVVHGGNSQVVMPGHPAAQVQQIQPGQLGAAAPQAPRQPQALQHQQPLQPQHKQPQQQQSPPVLPQLDGAGNNTSSEEDEDDEEEDDEEDEDDEEEGKDRGEEGKNGEHGQAEEEEPPLNSEDDLSDEDQDQFDTEYVVVCQYDKIHRTKNKWKFQLKDGIMNLNGRDYVFSKAIGDAEW